jgi:hypothetical protein
VKPVQEENDVALIFLTSWQNGSVSVRLQQYQLRRPSRMNRLLGRIPRGEEREMPMHMHQMLDCESNEQ